MMKEEKVPFLLMMEPEAKIREARNHFVQINKFIQTIETSQILGIPTTKEEHNL